MAETRFEWTIDGEGAGSTPWEFDSVTNNGSATFALDSNNPNNGTYAYRATADGSSTAYGAYAWTNTDKTTYWVRFYVYLDADLSNAAGGFTNTWLCQGYDGATFLFRMGVRTAGSTAISQWVFTYKFDQQASTTNFSLGAWHRVEIKFVTDAAAGGTQVYIDGTSIGTDLNQDTSAEFFDNILIGELSGNIDSADTVDFDDIVGDTTQPGVYSDDAGGTAHAETGSDAYVFGDSLGVDWLAVDNVGDAYDFSDSTSPIWITQVGVSDAYDFSDSVVGGQFFKVGLNDAFDFGDQVNAILVFIKSLSDSYDFSDTASPVLEFVIGVSDTYDIADTVAAIDTWVASVSDSYDFSDTQTETYVSGQQGYGWVKFTAKTHDVIIHVRKAHMTATGIAATVSRRSN